MSSRFKLRGPQKTRKSHKLVTRDIETQEEILISASFEAKQSIFPTAEQLTFIEQINAPSYSCDAVSQGSTGTLGLCVTKNAMPTLWLKSFLDPNGADATPVPLLKDLLIPTDAHRNQGVIDLRGNRGGSTDVALRFLCQIGDESIVSKLAQLEYHLSNWPRSMTTRRGTIIDLERLAKSHNTDLIRFGEESSLGDFVPQVGSTTLRLGVLERFGLDRESCRALRSIAASGYRWTVLTRGDEFSAAETFLYGLKSAHRFTVVGMTTRGGTGNPIWIELPNTKIRLRLSIARMFDRQIGGEVIEKKGVIPDRVQADVLKAEFEARSVLSLTNKMPPLVTDMAYETILKQIHRNISH